jgi:hypothetical protein
MNHLEPSYLRYIYDGLEKGDLHPDNAAALLEGMIGLYEAEFEENIPARERQKLLNTFAIWALLKKEVTAQFVAEILEVPTQEIIDFIATYSNWFTSPESGKYQLCHERLKVYLLQKLSEQEIALLHDKLVIRLEHAILEQKQDEFEIYGLEFLSVHYLTTAMLTGDGKKLIALSYDQNHWQRQIKLSKGFEWTKKGLKQVMTWASKFNDEEVIECGLQMVDLHHQEQNDVPQIVALVAEGEIEAALKRIETFGGNDKEGLQRKFILYMLCLMELTLLESKDKPFRKEAIEKILKHFDENMPVDHSILNWNKFFSSYLMFMLAFDLKKMELDYLLLFKYTDDIETTRIKENLIYTKKKLDIILECTKSLQNKSNSIVAIIDISKDIAKQGKLEMAQFFLTEAHKLVSQIKDSIWYIINISKELAKIGFNEKAFKCTSSLNEELKGKANSLIYFEIAKKGNIKYFFKGENFTINEVDKKKAFKTCILNQTQEIDIDKIRLIEDINFRCFSLACISTYYFKKGDIINCKKLMDESISNVSQIQFSYRKSIAIKDIIIEYVNQGFTEDAYNLFHEISSEKAKSENIDEIISVFTNNKAVELALSIANNDPNLLKIIAINTIDKYEFEKVNEIIDKISDSFLKAETQISISSLLRLKKNYQTSLELLLKAEKSAELIISRKGDLINFRNKFYILTKICIEYIRLGKSNSISRILNKFSTSDLVEVYKDNPYCNIDMIAIELIKVFSIDKFFLLENYSINGNSLLSKDLITKVIFETIIDNNKEIITDKSNELKTVIYNYIFKNSYSTTSKSWVFNQLIPDSKCNTIFNFLKNIDSIQNRLDYIKLIIKNRRDLIESKEYRDEIEFLTLEINNLPDFENSRRFNIKSRILKKESICNVFKSILLDSNFLIEAFKFEQNYPSDSIKDNITEKFIKTGRHSEILILIDGCVSIIEKCSWLLSLTRNLNNDFSIISPQIIENLIENLKKFAKVNDYESIEKVWLIGLKINNNQIVNLAYTQYLDLLGNINDKLITNNSYERICKHLIENKNLNYAINIANCITSDERTKGKILCEIGCLLVDIGKVKEGLSLLFSITNSYYRLNGLSECFLKLYRNIELIPNLKFEISNDFESLRKNAKHEILNCKWNQFNLFITLNKSVYEILAFSKKNLETDNVSTIWLVKALSNILTNGREVEANQLISIIINKHLSEVLNSLNYAVAGDLLESLLYVLKKVGRNDLILSLYSMIIQIKDDYTRSSIIIEFVKYFVSMNDIEAALKCASNIPNTSNTNWISKRAIDIIIEGLINQYSNKKDFILCLNNSFYLPPGSAKLEYWKQLGEKLFETTDFNEGLDKIFRVEIEDVKEHLYLGYLKGLNLENFQNKLISTSIKHLFSNPKHLKKLLNLYAINSVIISDKIYEDKVQRYNRSLNIQWAIDIKNQLPN